MAKREDLIETCNLLKLNPEKSRGRINKETGERFYESTVDDLEKAIRDFYVNKYKEEGRELSPFLEGIIALDSPMLALQIKHKKQEEQDKIWEDNNNWVFQEKIDGARCLLCYDIDYGWDAYSRGKSVDTYIPISYKTKLILPELNKNILTRYGIKSFIIDTELVPKHKEFNEVEGVDFATGTQLSFVDSILNSLDDRAIAIQQNNPLKFIVFDLILYNDKYYTEATLQSRNEALKKILQILFLAGLQGTIELVSSTMENKHDFYDNIIASGGEGVVAKDLNSKYIGKRNGDWVKLKRTVSQSVLAEKLGDTIEAFVSGFKEGNIGTVNEGRVTTLEFSVYLTDDFDEYLYDDNSNIIQHHIASISGLPDDLKNAITVIDEFGKVQLSRNIYGKVATIDGQDVTINNKRFAHATFKGWRPDRTAESCRMRKSFLESLVL